MNGPKARFPGLGGALDREGARLDGWCGRARTRVSTLFGLGLAYPRALFLATAQTEETVAELFELGFHGHYLTVFTPHLSRRKMWSKVA